MMNIWQKFKLWCAKLVIPSAKTLAGIAAAGITNGFNRTGDTTRDKIARISIVGVAASELGHELSQMLTDGKIDEGERDKIAKMLTPVFEKILKTLR